MTMQKVDIHRVMQSGRDFIEVYDKPTEEEFYFFGVMLTVGVGIAMCIIGGLIMAVCK
jgi:preprotein translocase subunit Sss1